MTGGAVWSKDVPFAIDAKGGEKFCWQGEIALKRSYGVSSMTKGEIVY